MHHMLIIWTLFIIPSVFVNNASVFHLNESLYDAIVAVYDSACGQTAFCDNSHGSRISAGKNGGGDCAACPKCYCDEECSLYGDCCVDKTLNDVIAGEYSDYMTTHCVQPCELCLRGNTTNAAKLYRITDDCPEDFNDAEIKNKCRESDSTDYETAIPVTSVATNVTYAGVHCAACNGVDVGELRYWSVRVSCDHDVPLRGVHEYHDIWRAVIANAACQLIGFVIPHGFSSVRECTFPRGPTCAIKMEQSVEDKRNVEMCNAFTAMVSVRRSDAPAVSYKNIFCARCYNGVENNCSVIDDEPVNENSMTLDVSVVFRPDVSRNITQQNITRCSDSEVNDTLTGKCRRLSCSPRTVLHHNKCVPIYDSVNGLGYQLRYSLIPHTPSLVTTERITSQYKQRIYERLENHTILYDQLLLTVLGSSNGRWDDRRFMVYQMDVDVKLVATGNLTAGNFEKNVLVNFYDKWISPDGLEFAVRVRDFCHDNPVLDEQTLSYQMSYSNLPRWLKLCERNCRPRSAFVPYTPHSVRSTCAYLSYKVSDTVMVSSTADLTVGQRTVPLGEYEICGDTVYICHKTLLGKIGTPDKSTPVLPPDKSTPVFPRDRSTPVSTAAVSHHVWYTAGVLVMQILMTI